jgi:hypothetical protein
MSVIPIKYVYTNITNTTQKSNMMSHTNLAKHRGKNSSNTNLAKYRGKNSRVQLKGKPTA